MRKLIVVLTFLIIMGTSLWAKPKAAPPPPEVHTYKAVWNSNPTEALLFQGTSIKVNGLCVEITLNDRLDTVLCGVKFVTETLPAQETAPETDPAPAPVVPTVKKASN